MDTETICWRVVERWCAECYIKYRVLVVYEEKKALVEQLVRELKGAKLG